ncbi:MAG TPA: c-type cytochrome [Chitinophagaceae bacterium]|jgi:mono/diheme cytochrome c family protein|nr:c-type cytochrome [Chitinophagaceae bacterium]
MKAKFSIACFFVVFIVAGGFTSIQKQKDPWPVPDKYLKMANPVKADAESLALGKELWAKHCQSCHGKTGKGDGSKAAQLKTQPEDLGRADIQKQPDGAFFYKTIEGREDMPSFKKKIPDQDDVWAVVNYLRTFKK